MTLGQARCLGVSGNLYRLYRFWTLSAFGRFQLSPSRRWRSARLTGMLGPQQETHVGHAPPFLRFGAGGVGELDGAMNQAHLVRVKGLSGGHGEENQLNSCSPSAAIHVPQGERAIRHARAPQHCRKAAQAGRLRAGSAHNYGSAVFCGRWPSAGCPSSAHQSQLGQHHGIRPFPHQFRQHVGVEQNGHASTLTTLGAD